MSTSGLRTDPELRAYFHDALHTASRHQRLQTSDATLHYLSCLLTDYAHADRLFDDTSDGRRLPPLALIYGQALQAPSTRERQQLLQRLGDLALFIGGLFGGRLQRRWIDLDYCVKMGAGAYGHLGDAPARHMTTGALQTVFHELAHGFGRFVGLLAEIGARRPGAPTDPVQLYALWEQSQSPQLTGRLSALGLTPITAPRRHH